eukprot:5386802-Amphidinium_carterae.1
MMVSLERSGYIRRFANLLEAANFVGGPPVISKLALLEKSALWSQCFSTSEPADHTSHPS